MVAVLVAEKMDKKQKKIECIQGVYPWELYMMAVLVAQKWAKNRSI